MVGRMLTRRRQVAAKVETTEGTWNAPGAADAGFLAYEPKIRPSIPLFTRRPARSTLTRFAGVPGVQTKGFTFGVDLVGSGVAATPPAFGTLLKGCGMKQVDPWKLTIGAITGGPFLAGERVTQATSGAIGIVVRRTATGTTTLWLLPVSGTFNGTNVLTGATSAATATPSAAVQGVAVAYAFDSTPASPALSLAGYFDGILYSAYGARGNPTFAFQAGQPGRINAEFNGVLRDSADAALLTGITYPTKTPPTFLGVALKLDNVAIPFQTVNINPQNQIADRPDAGASPGVLSYLITDRAPQLTIDPEAALKADFDFVGKAKAGTKFAVEFELVDTAGNSFFFGCPAAQVASLSDDDRNGLAVMGTTLDLVGLDNDGDDELVILCT